MKKFIWVALLLCSCGTEHYLNVAYNVTLENARCPEYYRLPSYQELKDGLLPSGTYWVKEGVAVTVVGGHTERAVTLHADLVCVESI